MGTIDIDRVGQHKFRLSLIVIDSLNLLIKLFCLKSFLNPRRVEVAIRNDKAKPILQNIVSIVANDKFPVEVVFCSRGEFCVWRNYYLLPNQYFHQRGTNGRMQDTD